MPTMDQVAWASCNITVGGETQPYGRGSLLPAAGTDDELAERALLRTVGALRVVDVVYTPEELADQARQRGESTAAREAAADVDPAVPLAQQTPGQVTPGLPTMVEPSGSPVVIGDEDLRHEHERQAAEAGERRAAAARRPHAGASKAQWAEYAVAEHGADRAETESLTRDQLRDRYGQNPAQAAAARAQADVASGLHQPAQE